MAVPDSSPRAFAAVSVRNPQRLVLPGGTFFPLDCCAIPWGCASAPTGVAPEALEKCAYSCKVFPQRAASVRGVGFGRPRWCHAHVSAFAYVRCMSRRCSYALSPRAWAHSRQSGRALRLVHTPLRRPSAGRRGEASMTPIVRVANHGFLV
jgi:hypothetical protein